MHQVSEYFILHQEIIKAEKTGNGKGTRFVDPNHSYQILSTSQRPRTELCKPERNTLLYQFSKSGEFSEPIFYYNDIAFSMIQRPKFQENERMFEVAMNGQNFKRIKQEGEREGESKQD